MTKPYKLTMQDHYTRFARIATWVHWLGIYGLVSSTTFFIIGVAIGVWRYWPQ